MVVSFYSIFASYKESLFVLLRQSSVPAWRKHPARVFAFASAEAMGILLVWHQYYSYFVGCKFFSLLESYKLRSSSLLHSGTWLKL